jgi:hypothetical protein
MSKLLSKFTVGDTIIRFDAHGKGAPQLSLHPKALAPVEHREFLPPDVEIVGLPARWQPVPAFSLDSMVQLKCLKDKYSGSFAGPGIRALELHAMELCPSVLGQLVGRRMVSCGERGFCGLRGSRELHELTWSNSPEPS